MPCAFCGNWVRHNNDTEWMELPRYSGRWMRYHRLCHRYVIVCHFLVALMAGDEVLERDYLLLELIMELLQYMIELILEGR